MPVAEYEKVFWLPRYLPAFILAVLSCLSLPGGLSGQVVEGHLFDSETRGPVISGRVALRDSIGTVIVRAASDEEGAYRLTAPGPGVYSLMAGGMGYRSTPTGQFEVKEGEVMSIDLSLYPQPIELDPLAVLSRRQRIDAKLRKHGFYDRQQQGFGTFLTLQQIKRWPALNVGDVLRHAPFVSTNYTLSEGSTIYISKYGRCRPTIYVDGGRISSSPDHWVAPEDIVGVEVYRGSAEIPLEWGGTESCGVILIWTSLGGGRGPGFPVP